MKGGFSRPNTHIYVAVPRQSVTVHLAGLLGAARRQTVPHRHRGRRRRRCLRHRRPLLLGARRQFILAARVNGVEPRGRPRRHHRFALDPHFVVQRLR